jgi:predicted small secreted protein
MRKITAATLIAASLMLSACNMVKGLGRDIESVGEAGDRVIDRETPEDGQPADS